MSTPNLLEISGLRMRFGPNEVLKDINLTLSAGEIVALLGENGAGKSTLVNIIAGGLTQTGGTMKLDGEVVEFGHPRHALERGIALIHQELSLIRSLSVQENIFLNNYFAGRGGFIDKRKMAVQAREMLDRLGGERISASDLAGSLSAADQQTVEIAKALVHKPRILIMDEPTSSLTQHEAEAFFEVVRRLRSEGVTIVFIGHRLEEAFAISDRITVMRDGHLVSVKPASETTIPEVVKNMVGREIDLSARRFDVGHAAKEQTPVLELSGIGDNTLLDDVALTVAPGEVVGLFGLVGAGRSELLSAIVGDRPRIAGRITYKGNDVSFASPEDALNAGIALLPEGRKEQGIFPNRSIYQNMNASCSPRYTRYGFMRDGELMRDCQRNVDRFEIKLQSLSQRIEELSGGNQQKVILSRLLLCKPQLLMLDEPTHGVDVRTKSQIYDTIHELAASGVAIVLVSSELPELLINAHRIVVLAAGRVTKELENVEGLEERDVLQHAFID